jgi:hypothetical protein
MPGQPTFARQMLAKIEAALLRMEPGVRSATFNGQTVTYDDLQALWQRWSTEVAKENGTITKIVPLNLGGGP